MTYENHHQNIAYIAELHEDRIIHLINKFYPDLSKDDIIGHGNFGTCFQKNEETVVKVTCDIREVYTAIQLLGENTHYPDILNVRQLDGDFYFIEQSRMAPLTIDDQPIVIELFETINKRQELDEGTTLDSLLSLTEEGKLDFACFNRYVEPLGEAIMDLMRKVGIEVLDLKLENAMLKDGIFSLIDQRESHPSLPITREHLSVISNHMIQYDDRQHKKQDNNHYKPTRVRR